MDDRTPRNPHVSCAFLRSAKAVPLRSRTSPSLALRGLLLSLVALLAVPAAAASGEGGRVQPLLFAHYYSWYDDMNTWASGVPPDLPVRLYQSADRAIREQHVEQALAARIDPCRRRKAHPTRRLSRGACASPRG